MAAFSAIAIGIGAAASVVGTVASIKAQKKQARAQQKQQTLQHRQSQRAAVRQAQIQRASLVAGAAGAGAGGSSGAAGGVGGITSPLGGALGYGTQMSALSGIISTQQQKAANFNALASLGGGLMNYGLSTPSGQNFVQNLFQPTRAAVPDFTGTIPRNQ